MATENSLIIFKAISNFTTCLDEVFGQSNRSLKLYAHLISKTTIAHENPIQKHINVFRDFCIQNRDAITSKDSKKFIKDSINYSNRVYINVKDILKESDSNTTSVIWKHLLTLSALMDPVGKAREILEESIQKGGENVKEADFLNNIIGKVEQHVDPDANPMDAVSSIMKSGIFTELVGGMGNGLQDGSLDLGKLMGTVQKMVTSLNDTNEESCVGGDDGGASNLMNTMMSNLSAGSVPNSGGNPPGVPDISAIMGMMGPMLGALSGQPVSMPNVASTGNPIQDRIEAQVQKAKESGELQSSSVEEIE